MGEIKSALEIALERTASVAGDKEAVAAGEARKEGKILVSRFLDDPEASLVIPGKSGKEQEVVFIPQKVADRLKEYIREKGIGSHQRIFPHQLRRSETGCPKGGEDGRHSFEAP